MISLTKPLTLIFIPQDQIVVSFPKGLKGAAIFDKKFTHIKLAMKTIGLDLPNKHIKGHLKIPTEKRKIFLEDADFGIAFYELYYKQTMNPDQFKWKEPTS